jgi:hypothetical protein
VVPLKSEEGMTEIRKEYKFVSRGWNSPEKEPELAVGHGDKTLVLGESGDKSAEVPKNVIFF